MQLEWRCSTCRCRRALGYTHCRPSGCFSLRCRCSAVVPQSLREAKAVWQLPRGSPILSTEVSKGGAHRLCSAPELNDTITLPMTGLEHRQMLVSAARAQSARGKGWVMSPREQVVIWTPPLSPSLFVYVLLFPRCASPDGWQRPPPPGPSPAALQQKLPLPTSGETLPKLLGKDPHPSFHSCLLERLREKEPPRPIYTHCYCSVVGLRIGSLTRSSTQYWRFSCCNI